MVWKDTTRLGVARSTFYKDSKKCSVVVAKYFPSKNKTAVVSNVVRGDYDAKSYCDGLGAVYPSSPGEEQSNNLVKTVLPKRIVTQNIQGELFFKKFDFFSFFLELQIYYYYFFITFFFCLLLLRIF